MKPVYTGYFFIIVFFTSACSRQGKEAVSQALLSKDGILNVAYLDSASNQLYTDDASFVEGQKINRYGFEKGDIVLYPDSVYEQRINSLTSDFSLAFNEQVSDYINMYAYRKKKLTERMLGKSVLYFPFIEEMLSQQGLPQDLKLLTMIESALQPTAESSKSASGLWQIRYETGRALGLTINSYVDERRDPYASSKAGIMYLQKLYNLYHDWWLAIAAYNCGMGTMNKALVKAGNTHDYWEVSQYLPHETRNYVPAFIAMVYLYHYKEEHNLQPASLDVPFRSIDTVKVYQQASLKKIAESIGVPLQVLVFLNPKLLRHVVPSSPEGIALTLPINKIATFERNCAGLLERTETRDQTIMAAKVLKAKTPVVPKNADLVEVIYTIKPGNTLDEISKQYDCSVKQLMDWNALHDPLLQVGYDLKIYVPENSLDTSMPATSSDLMLTTSTVDSE